MKPWRADYKILYKDGRIEEQYVIIEEHDITRALATAINEVVNPIRMEPEVAEVAVSDIGIMADDVF